MQTVTYTCDRCKASDQTNNIDLIPIKIILFSFNTEVKSGDWCRKCLIKTGLLAGNNLQLYPDIKVIEPPPTLEDIIREIVRKEYNLENI